MKETEMKLVAFICEKYNINQVVQKLTLGLQISGENNRFALYEAKNNTYNAIDDRTTVADVLAKIEK